MVKVLPKRMLFVSVLLLSSLPMAAEKLHAVELTIEELDAAMQSQDSNTWQVRPDGVPVPGHVGVIDEVAEVRDQHTDMLLDWRPNDEADEPDEPIESLPIAFDWRDFPDRHVLPPVEPHQGECGSCVAYAVASAVATQLNISCGSNAPPFNLSQQYFFSCGGGDCQRGWRLSEAVSYLESHGLPDDSCMPYTAFDGQNIPCSFACADAAHRLFRSIDARPVTRGTIDVVALKRALLKGPLLANMILYEDLRYYETGVYRHVSGRQEGSHAVVIIGWDDRDRSWIVRNSWGPDYGEGGYFRTARDDNRTLVGRYAWSFNVTQAVSSGACSRAR